MLNCPPVPSFLQRPLPGPEAWERFWEHYRRLSRHKFVPEMPKKIPAALQQPQPEEEPMALDGQRNLGRSLEGDVFDKDTGTWIRGLPPRTRASVEEASQAGDFKAHGAETDRTPKTGRGVVVDKDDIKSLTLAELLARAVPLGYVEKPEWPNGGVRVMRIRNFLNNLVKKQGAK